MLNRDPLQLPIAALLVCIAVVSLFTSGHFGKELFAEIVILSILVMSLDLLVGVAGLVSLGHAGFLAIGAYATAGVTVLLGWPPVAGIVCAVAATAMISLGVGVLVIRLTGVFFIMVTLAIGQMFHAYFFKASAFGGDNGIAGTPRVDLSLIGLDTGNSTVFAALMLIVSALVYVALLFIKRSPFGMTLAAINQNEGRMTSLGCPVRRYKLAAFCISGTIAGLAGSLMAQHTGFVSPDLAFWTVSGQTLIIVIIGGSGSLIGSAAGAVLFVLLRDQLSDGSFWKGIALPSDIANHWQLFMGIFFIAVVFIARDGLYGRITWIIRRITERRGA